MNITEMFWKCTGCVRGCVFMGMFVQVPSAERSPRTAPGTAGQRLPQHGPAGTAGLLQEASAKGRACAPCLTTNTLLNGLPSGS